MLISNDNIVCLTKDTLNDISMIHFYFDSPCNNYLALSKYKDTSYYSVISNQFRNNSLNMSISDDAFKTLSSFVFWKTTILYDSIDNKGSNGFYSTGPPYILRGMNEHTPNIVTNLDSVTIHRLFLQFEGRIINSDYVKSIYMDTRYYYCHKNFFLSLEFRLKNGDTLKYREIPNLKIDQDDGLKKPYLIL